MKTRRSDPLFIISGVPGMGGVGIRCLRPHHKSPGPPGWPVGTEVVNKQENAHFGGVEPVMRMVPAT